MPDLQGHSGSKTITATSTSAALPDQHPQLSSLTPDDIKQLRLENIKLRNRKQLHEHNYALLRKDFEQWRIKMSDLLLEKESQLEILSDLLKREKDHSARLTRRCEAQERVYETTLRGLEEEVRNEKEDKEGFRNRVMELEEKLKVMEQVRYKLALWDGQQQHFGEDEESSFKMDSVHSAIPQKERTSPKQHRTPSSHHISAPANPDTIDTKPNTITYTQPTRHVPSLPVENNTTFYSSRTPAFAPPLAPPKPAHSIPASMSFLSSNHDTFIIEKKWQNNDLDSKLAAHIDQLQAQFGDLEAK
jgi:phage shock protein A